MKDLEFALLSGGTGYNDIAWNFQGYGLATAEHRNRRDTVWQDFSYIYTVIKHPTAGYILFDVGLGSREEIDRRPAEHRNINPVAVARDQYIDEGLKKLGLTVNDISAIIISHCHWDHIGGLEFFRETKAIKNVYVPYLDFQRALVQTHRASCGYSDSGYYRKNIDVDGAEYHLIEEESELFPGIDVLLLEGHTPAVAGLVLHLEGGNYILPSDAVTAEVCLRGTAKPGVIYDSLGFERTRKRLLRLEKELNAKFIFSHDPWNFPLYTMGEWIQ